MIVVSNTSPLNYLILLSAVDVLPRLYSRIWVPPAVLTELAALGSPDPVRNWVRQTPEWMIVREPSRADSFLNLHLGEVQAIALAQELAADRILIDDRRGARVAISQGLHAIGLLAVLDEAASQGLIQLSQVLDQLQETNFRMTGDLRAVLLARQANRDRRQDHS